MTLYLYSSPRSVNVWNLPDWTEDLDAIIAALRGVYWKVVVER